MKTVGIIGGAGYTAGELIRILMHHPDVELSFIQSNSQSGTLISDVHADLEGDLLMEFSENMSHEVDVLFL